jgi:hypothetical protein
MSVEVDVRRLFVELVASENVACAETYQIVGSRNMWRVECMLYRGGNKEKAKAGLTKFLQQAWGAEDIKFTVAKGSKPGQFCCTFRSDIF